MQKYLHWIDRNLYHLEVIPLFIAVISFVFLQINYIDTLD